VMPIVHGLEKQFRGRVDFLYLHVGEPRTSDAKARLGFKSTPHILLLRADGTKVREFIGVVEEGVLKQALAELAPRRSR
jgi:thioredoxin-like negative regulator of GroEL